MKTVYTDYMRRTYGSRPGLDGPYAFYGDRILYFDPVEGKYWDPTTDFYLDEPEEEQLKAELVRLLCR